MGFLDFLNGARRGRKPHEPKRETRAFPTIQQLGPRGNKHKYLYKPTPRNLRYFSHSPYARRAINAIKSPIAMLPWKIAPHEGVELNSELERQIEVATLCFKHPNQDDSFESLCEQTVEDYLIGGAAIEMQLSGDKIRPLWMFPVDGLSIQIYPGWTGQTNEARYAQVIGYGTAFGGGTVAELRNDELIYMKPNASTATPFGFGPIEIAFNTINAILGVAEFAGNVASNQRPSIMIDLGEGWTDEQLRDFRQYWRNEVEGQGNVPFASSASSGRADEKSKRGTEVHRLYPEGDSGMFLEYQKFLLRTLAAACDLSPQNLGVEGDVNRNVSEVAEDRDWNQAIKPTAAKISAHLTREALHGKLGFSQLRHQFVGLDREDEKANAEIFKIRYEGNAITPNEYRAKLGEPASDSEWADMTFADMQIAVKAAQGAAEVDDNALNKGKPKAKQKSKKGLI
jgi:phage portal protein BeeE